MMSAKTYRRCPYMDFAKSLNTVIVPVNGNVREFGGGPPIDDSVVSAVGPAQTVRTFSGRNPPGTVSGYGLNLFPEDYRITADKFGYFPQSFDVVVDTRFASPVNFNRVPMDGTTFPAVGPVHSFRP